MDKEGLSIGSYQDYFMKDPETQEIIAGICHAKGGNTHLPPYWLLYIAVEDLDQSLETCKRLGGKVLGEKRRVALKTNHTV